MRDCTARWSSTSLLALVRLEGTGLPSGVASGVSPPAFRKKLSQDWVGQKQGEGQEEVGGPGWHPGAGSAFPLEPWDPEPALFRPWLGVEVEGQGSVARGLLL